MRLLVACAACKRQFDATGIASGSRFHCACGKIVKVPAAHPHDARVVRCSSCGAPRDRGSAFCKFCQADFTLHEQDLETICPSCMTRLSNSARFCHSCGTAIHPEGSAGQRTEKDCPACGETHRLLARSIGPESIPLHECSRCAGMWMGRPTFQALAAKARAEALPDELFHGDGTKPAAAGEPQKGGFYRRCPECGQMMARRNFGGRSGVILDSCPPHGLWFDCGELERIIEWIREGGEARAKKRLERERKERERLSRFSPGRRLDEMARRAGEPGIGAGTRRIDDGGALFELLGDLFVLDI